MCGVISLMKLIGLIVVMVVYVVSVVIVSVSGCSVVIGRLSVVVWLLLSVSMLSGFVSYVNIGIVSMYYGSSIDILF